MKLWFDGKSMKKLDIRREKKKLVVVNRICRCGHGRAFRYDTGRVKCCRCGDITWE